MPDLTESVLSELEYPARIAKDSGFRTVEIDTDTALAMIAAARRGMELQETFDEIGRQLANEKPHDLEHLLACAMIGKHTTVIGKARHAELLKYEAAARQGETP